MGSSTLENLIAKITWVFQSIDNVWVFILDFIGFYGHDRRLTLRTKLGPSLMVRAASTDLAEVAVIFSDSEYPQRFFPKKKGCTIVDLGANIGAFSIYSASILKKFKPRIIAVEPSSENFQLLTSNISANRLGKLIKPLQVAITNRNGTAILDTSGAKDAFKISSKRTLSHEVIKSRTLVNLCRSAKISKINLLKVDIEGSEFEVIGSSINTLRKKVESIIVEIHKPEYDKSTIKLIDTLDRNKFTLVEKINGKNNYFFKFYQRV